MMPETEGSYHMLVKFQWSAGTAVMIGGRMFSENGES
jgi:hypothetical protein